MKSLELKNLQKVQQCMTAEQFNALQSILLTSCYTDENFKDFTNWVINNRHFFCREDQGSRFGEDGDKEWFDYVEAYNKIMDTANVMDQNEEQYDEEYYVRGHEQD